MPQRWLRVSVFLSGFVGRALACTHCSPMLTSSTVQVPEAAATVEEQEGRVRQTHGQATERCEGEIQHMFKFP